MLTTVAVIDSGWNREISDPRVLPGIAIRRRADGTLEGDDDDHDALGHGTEMAQIILRLAPASQILPVRVFISSLNTNASNVVAAMHWALREGASIISLSLSTRLRNAIHPLYRASQYAWQEGTIVVAAAENGAEWSAPASFDNVIGAMAAASDGPLLLERRHRAPADFLVHGDQYTSSPRRLIRNSHAAAALSGLIASEYDATRPKSIGDALAILDERCSTF